MKKTSLYIEPEVDHALARLAEAEGISKAELIRRTLREASNGAPPARITGIGALRGAPPDLSTNFDYYLAQSDFGRD
jgi:Ribbon-helix-helix protein, copG family